MRAQSAEPATDALPDPSRAGVFALAALALAAAGEPGLAAVYAVCAAVNAMVLTRFEQWEA